MRILRAPDGTGGGGTADLAPYIPEEFRQEKSLEAIKDVPTLVKSYVNAQKLIGQDRVILPNDQWKDEDWNAFYTKLGRPQKPEEYGLPTDVKLDESLQIDEAKLNAVKGTFHQLGLSKKQAEGVLRYYFGSLNEQVKAQQTAAQQTIEQGTAALRQEWADKFDTNLVTAKTALEKFGSPELKSFVETSGIGNNPEFIKLLHKIGVSMGEDHSQRGGGPAGGMTKETALAEIDRMKQDPDMIKLFSGDTSLDPKKKQELISKWESMHKIAFPGQVTG